LQGATATRYQRDPSGPGSLQPARRAVRYGEGRGQRAADHDDGVGAAGRAGRQALHDLAELRGRYASMSRGCAWRTSPEWHNEPETAGPTATRALDTTVRARRVQRQRARRSRSGSAAVRPVRRTGRGPRITPQQPAAVSGSPTAAGQVLATAHADVQLTRAAAAAYQGEGDPPGSWRLRRVRRTPAYGRARQGENAPVRGPAASNGDGQQYGDGASVRGGGGGGGSGGGGGVRDPQRTATAAATRRPAITGPGQGPGGRRSMGSSQPDAAPGRRVRVAAHAEFSEAARCGSPAP